MRRSVAAPAAGFTLIETLIALAILGIVLSTVFAVFGSGLRSAQRDEDRLLLALVAQNLLNRSGLDLYPGQGSLSGDIGGGLRWRIEGEPFELPKDLLPERRGPEAPETSLLDADEGERGIGASSGTGFERSQGSFGESSSSRTGGTGFGEERRAEGGPSDSTTSDSGFAPMGQTEREREGTERARERNEVRLLLVTVTVEKGGERFQLQGLAQEPHRGRDLLR